jgi:hypothetical protein
MRSGASITVALRLSGLTLGMSAMVFLEFRRRSGGP